MNDHPDFETRYPGCEYDWEQEWERRERGMRLSIGGSIFLIIAGALVACALGGSIYVVVQIFSK